MNGSLKATMDVARKSFTLATIGSLLAISVPMGLAHALDTGLLSPTGVDAAHDEWASATNAFSNDDIYATETSEDDDQSFESFGFSITPDSRIDGIEVAFEAIHTDSAGCQAEVRMWSASDNEHTDYITQEVDGADTDTYYTLGSSSNLWGSTWEQGDFSDGNFHVEMRFDDVSGTSCSAGTFSLDHIQVRVYYTAPYTVTASAGANGSISPSGAVVVTPDDDEVFTITPNAGYIVEDVLIDSASQGRLNEYTFDTVDANHTISATFANGWMAPTDAENDTGVSSEDNAFTSNESDAVFGGSGDQVEYDEFGFSIPTGATIDGIEVAVEGERTAGRTFDISLSSDNGSTWSPTVQTVAFSSTESTIVVGGPTDTWGRSWTAAEINDTFEFQVLVDAAGGGGNINLDQLQVKVYYTENTAPTAQDVSDSTNEDVAKAITLVATDTESDPITYATTSNPTNGTLSAISGDQVTYTPNANYFGSDSFTYVANDGALDSAPKTVSITISAVNDVPTANDDAYSTDEDVTLNVSAPGVLTNDTDNAGENDSLSAVLVSDVSNGTLTLNSDGSFSYEPDDNFSGQDSFTYSANDTGTGSTATVTIDVDSTNDVPTVAADAYNAIEDTQLDVLVGAGVLVNDTDLDGQTLTVTVQDDVTDGTLTLNADGSFTYLPDTDFVGVDSFTYIACETTAPNACSGEATVDVTVGDINDDPILDPISDQTVVYGETPVTFTATASDIDSTTMTYSLSGEPAGATINSSTGVFSWDITGVAPSVNTFDVIVEDGEGGDDSQSVTITINKADTAIAITNAIMLASSNSQASGFDVTWAVDVNDPGAGTPTGTVTVFGAFSNSCTAPIASGVCELESQEGTDMIFAVYNGDTNFNSSTSTTVAHEVIDTSDEGNNGGGGGGGGNGPIVGSSAGAVLGASIGPSVPPQGQVLGASTSTATSTRPTATTTPATTTPAACSALITKIPMRQGLASNDAEQVKALKGFLNGEMGTTLAVDGSFDAATTLAVNAFQLKYAGDILAPWGLTQPTGVVYLLSQWKINMLHCPALNLTKPSVN